MTPQVCCESLQAAFCLPEDGYPFKEWLNPLASYHLQAAAQSCAKELEDDYDYEARWGEVGSVGQPKNPQNACPFVSGFIGCLFYLECLNGLLIPWQDSSGVK